MTGRFFLTFEAAGDRREAILAAVSAYVQQAALDPLEVVRHITGYDRDADTTWIRVYIDSMDVINAALKADPLEISGERFVVPGQFFSA